MRKHSIVLAVLASLSSAVAPAADTAPGPAPPAVASPLAIGRCIWASLPKATREALLAVGPGIDAFMHAADSVNPALLKLAGSRCPPVAVQDREAVASAWTAVVITAWSQAQLAARFGVSEAALQASWRHVGPEARAKLAADEDETPGEIRPDLAGQAAELGLTTPEGQELLVFWSMTQLKLAAMGG